MEEAYYRVAQEALTNVARHSGASHVEIQLAWTDKTLEMIVRDDGQGFVVEESAGKGLGLASMRERVEALGGALTISSGASGTLSRRERRWLGPSPWRNWRWRMMT